MAEHPRLPLKYIDAQSLRWQPEEDITPYELALAVPVLIGVMEGTARTALNRFLDLPETVKRHFGYSMKPA